MQISTLKHKTQEFNIEIYALYLSFRDKRVAWQLRLMLAFLIGYGISPIDLVPDLTPIFGFLDDIVLVTIGLYMVYQLVSKDILNEARMRAFDIIDTKGEAAAYRIVMYVWMLGTSLLAILLYKILFLNML